MKRKKSQKKALLNLNYDLFEPENLNPPPSLNISSKIRLHSQPSISPEIIPTPIFEVTAKAVKGKGELPTVSDLYKMFETYNQLYFNGKLPPVKIEYSLRMTNAGSYTPALKLIKISKKYHEIFPDEITDTLKHEMIHIIHYRHDAAFKAEAKRIGASLKAKSHPSLMRKTKYLYFCPSCKRDYPRNKRLVLASCGYCSSGGKYDSRYKLKPKKRVN